MASERLAGKVLVPRPAEPHAEAGGLIVPGAADLPSTPPAPAGGTADQPGAPAGPPASPVAEGQTKDPAGAASGTNIAGPKHGSSISPQLPLKDTPQVVARHFGSYEIISEISRGSFGVVYRAKQHGLDRLVALKVLLAGAYASSEMVARFQREARAVARLKHPNVVPIYEIGTHEGHHYFAMEFVEGYALSELVAKRGITTQRALEIAEVLADALESAHRAGVIHRDIKPSNIIVDAQGQPHITDFGLAKQVDLDTKYTMSGTTLGTPAYMPPEQARGEVDRIDARSDVYAIGAVMYEMLTGRTPFVGRSLLEIVVAVINEPVQPPRQLNPRIHRDVQTIVCKCLEKDPNQRYASAAELRDDISRFRSGEAIRAKPAGVVRRTARLLKRHSVLVGAAALACVALGLAVTIVKRAKEENKEVVEGSNKIRKELLEDRDKLRKELIQVKVSKVPIWLPDWWFPPKDLGTLADDEQRKQYTIPEGKAPVFRGLAPGKDIWDLQVLRVKVKDGFEVQKKTVRLRGNETLVSPEECRSFGDIEAQLSLTLAEWGPEKRLRIGLESQAAGHDSIPYLLEVAAGSVRLIGPEDLYTYTSPGDAGNRLGRPPPGLPPQPAPGDPGNKRFAGPKLEIKAEKDAPDLVNGAYTLRILRDGMSLSFQLDGPPGFQAVALGIRDVNLSNWMFKTTQLIVVQPPPGMTVTAAEIKHRVGGDERDAFRHFREGDYNTAEGELKAITESGEADHAVKARAYHLLGLLREICQPNSGRELGHYRDALTQLELLPAEQAAAVEQADRAKELHLRRLIRFAKDKKWEAVTKEMYDGWGQEGQIGEPLAWELDTVLELALREPTKEFLPGDGDKPLSIQAAQMVFKRLGLVPGSAVFGHWAVELARKLDSSELLALYDAYPSHMLNRPLYDAVNKALETDKFNLALVLLRKMESRTETDDLIKTQAACDALRAAMDKRRYADAATFFAARPNLQVLTILCSRIEAQARDLATKPKDSASGSNLLNLFLAKVPPAVWAKLPAEPSARPLFCDALGKLAPEIVSGGTLSDLTELHRALRGGRPQDPRLAQSFAEAAARLATSPRPDAEVQALNLLRYCAAHVERDSLALRNAVMLLAASRVQANEPRNENLLLALHAAYPAPQLLTPAREVLLALRREGRYEEMLAFFTQARIEFGADASVLTPHAVVALQNVKPPERQAELLSKLWSDVHGSLAARQLAGDERRWQLEYADIELVLEYEYWDKARERYLGLYNTRELEPELQARVGLRLGALNLARPAGVTPSDPLLPLLAMEGPFEEYKLAAQLLATPERLRMADLEARLKPLNAPLRLSEAEWDLFRALRLRMDGDQALARDMLSAAARKSAPSRTWVNGVATYLLNPPNKAPKQGPESK